MLKFRIVIVYCFIIVTILGQTFDDLLFAGNYIVPQYAQRQEVQFNYGPDSTLGGPARRVATPIVEDDTEPPVYFPPSSQAVQLDRKAKVVPQPKQSYPVYQALNQGDFRYSYNYY